MPFRMADNDRYNPMQTMELRRSFRSKNHCPTVSESEPPSSSFSNVSTNPLLPSYGPADSSPEGVLGDDNIPLQSNGANHATSTDSICYPISEAIRPDATEKATQIDRAIHMRDNAGTEDPLRKKRGRPRKDGGDPMESQEEVCAF